MRHFFLTPRLGFLAVVLLVAPDAAAAQTGSSRTTLDGVYTEEQAARGAQVKQNLCDECHYDEDFTDILMSSWVEASANALFDVIATQMPEDNPGSLAPGQYADVLAYIFKMNGMPAGSSALEPSADALRNIIIKQKP